MEMGTNMFFYISENEQNDFDHILLFT